MPKPYPKVVSKKTKSKKPKSKKPKSELSKLDAKLWEIFSEYIRRKDADENGIARCVTCGVFGHWKTLQCGHFISRRELSTKFDEKNNACQCVKCNILNQGAQFEYSIYIDKNTDLERQRHYLEKVNKFPSSPASIIYTRLKNTKKS